MNLRFHRWTQTIQLFGINKQNCILSVVYLQAKIKWRITDRNFKILTSKLTWPEIPAIDFVSAIEIWIILIIRIGRVAKVSVNKIKSYPVNMSIWEQRRFKYPIVSSVKVPNFCRQFFRIFCSIPKKIFVIFWFVNFSNFFETGKIYLLFTVSSSNNNRLGSQCDWAMTASSLF